MSRSGIQAAAIEGSDREQDVVRHQVAATVRGHRAYPWLTQKRETVGVGRTSSLLGGVIAGDLGALGRGLDRWINEDQLVALTGASVAPKLYLALGVDGDTSQFMATQEAGMIVAVQPDPSAPFVPVADYNIIADPAEFAGVLLKVLGK